ncbi:MAG: beta-lactamase family protein, partial [Chloroflexi bacterium]|nr:beta-lactamase family protein [Chloroflexota bacterium]
MAFPSTRLDRRHFLGLAATASATIVPLLAPRRGMDARAAPDNPAPPTPTDLENGIVSTMQAHGIPGANVVLDRPDTGTWTAALGVSDLQRGTPMSPDLHMRIGSITKTMTATVVLQLVDEGALGLDDTLATLLPDVTTIPYASQITVRHLLSMKSGTFDCLKDETFFPQVFADPTRPWTPHEMIALAARHPPDFAPGEDIAYSNTGYILLGLIAERLANEPLGAAYDRRLFAPLGMSQTSLPTDATLTEPFAHGYIADPRRGGQLADLTALNATVAWAAGGVVSTVGDLHTWLKALVGGSLLSADLQRERLVFTPFKRDPGAPPFGYGLGIGNLDGQIG